MRANEIIKSITDGESVALARTVPLSSLDIQKEGMELLTENPDLPYLMIAYKDIENDLNVLVVPAIKRESETEAFVRRSDDEIKLLISAISDRASSLASLGPDDKVVLILSDKVNVETHSYQSRQIERVYANMVNTDTQKADEIRSSINNGESTVESFSAGAITEADRLLVHTLSSALASNSFTPDEPYVAMNR